MHLTIKRIYDSPSPNDGYRILVDRLWPRGVSKERAHLDRWLKDIAPSSELRRWFNHQPERFEEFTHRYQYELEHNDALKEMQQLIQAHPRITLLYGAKDPTINHAHVLLTYLLARQAQ